MTSFSRYVFIAAAVISLAGCRQPDGPLPASDDEVQNRLGDMTRDLLNVAARQPDAGNEFAEDLTVFARSPEGEEASRAFARRVVDVIPGSRLNDQSAQRLAHSCWMAVAGRELSQRQVEGVQNDIEGLLSSIGVPEEPAHAVAEQVSEVQRVVTIRPRRWYELF
jgi:hypothetical protein